MLARIPRAWMTGLSIMAMVLVCHPATAQFAIEPPPASSSYWWTLSDEVSPEELRRQLQSRRLSRERLRADVDAGLHAPVGEDRLAELSVYVNGKTTPELIPMWDAFDRYSFHFYHDKDYGPHAIRELQEWGLSREGAELVTTVAQEHLEIEARVVEETRELELRFAYEVVKTARERIGEEAADRIVREKDFTWLGRLAGVNPDSVRTWHQAWLRDPMAEAGMVSIETLGERLSSSDWGALRRFLLREVALRMHHEYFSKGGFR